MNDRPHRRRRRPPRPATSGNDHVPPAGVHAAALTRRTALDALAILRDESPATYRQVSVQLAAAPADITVEGERIGVTSAGGIVRVRSVPPDAPLLVATVDRAGIVQLIDGTITIEQLLERRRLHVRGHPDALLGFLSAARAFADAATRSTALQRGFERYRESLSAVP
jgi:hypothetical protein